MTKLFFVRVGYKSLFKANSEEGLTFGGGLKYKLNDSFKIIVNYGYADYGRLENVQFFRFRIILLKKRFL